MPPSTVIQAAELFQSKEQRSQPPLSFPEFTAEDLLALGVEVFETPARKMVKIPFETQKSLIESVKVFGFGVNKAVDQMLKRILAIFELSGQVKFHTPDGTHDLVAWVERATEEEPKLL